MSTRIEKYKLCDEFKPHVGGKATGVFLALGNKIFPEDENGCCGFFHKNKKGTPLFTRVESNKVIATYNLLSYVAIDCYNEPFMF